MQILISDRRNGALRPSERPETPSARRKADQGYYEWCENNMPIEAAADGVTKTAVAYLENE